MLYIMNNKISILLQIIHAQGAQKSVKALSFRGAIIDPKPQTTDIPLVVSRKLTRKISPVRSMPRSRPEITGGGGAILPLTGQEL